jgi:primosomal protein N'
VEDNVSGLFPEAVVKRMDADVMTRKDAYRETLDAFRRGNIDILVGTQMIAKGLHFPNVTLVGIVNADLSLHLARISVRESVPSAPHPGRRPGWAGDVTGEVLVQTFTPAQSEHSVRSASRLRRVLGPGERVSAELELPPLRPSRADSGPQRASRSRAAIR